MMWKKDHLTINLHLEEDHDQIIRMHCPPAWERKMRYNHRRVTDA